MPIIIPASSRVRDGWIGNRKIDDCVAISNCGAVGSREGGREGRRDGGTRRVPRAGRGWPPFEIAPT